MNTLGKTKDTDDETISIELIHMHLNGVNSTRNFLTNLTAEKFVDLVNKNQEFPSFQKWMNYYLWLFRNEEEFQLIISHPTFPSKFLVKFIYYSLGEWIKADNDPDDFFMEIASLFNPEKCLQILIEEDIVELDVNLALALISNLDEKGIHLYFHKTDSKEDVSDFFYNLFSELEDTMIKSFFIKNPELYTYILQMFQSEKDKSIEKQKKYERFVKKFKVDLEMIELILSIKEKVLTKFDLEKEKLLPCSKRNLSRLVGIINAIKGKENSNDIIQILYRQRVIIDREEKELMRSILNDDHIKYIFKLSEHVTL